MQDKGGNPNIYSQMPFPATVVVPTTSVALELQAPASIRFALSRLSNVNPATVGDGRDEETPHALDARLGDGRDA